MGEEGPDLEKPSPDRLPQHPKIEHRPIPPGYRGPAGSTAWNHFVGSAFPEKNLGFNGRLDQNRFFRLDSEVMEIILATGNPHKKEELSRILSPHRILIPPDIGVAFDAEETGSTYLANAMIKAKALAAVSGGRPVLADDSGISVPALGGEPGVFSARYGSMEEGRDLEAAERNELLLRNMAGLSGEARRAFLSAAWF